MNAFNLSKSLVVMKKKQLFETCAYALSAVWMAGTLLVGCADRDENYPTGNEPEPESSLFDFRGSIEVNASINYGVIAKGLPFEMYTEYPLEWVEGELVKKEGVQPVFADFLDQAGSYHGKVDIPSRFDMVYLYSDYAHLPECVELKITDDAIRFTLPKTTRAAAATRDLTGGEVANAVCVPIPDMADYNLYSLCTWGRYGKANENGYITMQQVSPELSRAASAVLPVGYDNSRYAVSANVVNIEVIQSTNIGVTILGERAGDQSPLGYYYYPTGTTPDVEKLPKYVLFPNVSISSDDPYTERNYYYQARNGKFNKGNAPISIGSTTQLQYFGADYQAKASYDFPPGVTIGWFIIPNGFTPGSSDRAPGTISLYKHKSHLIYSSSEYYNETVNGYVSYFTAMRDSESGKMVVGLEDDAKASFNYSDILFSVDANPISAIFNPQVPEIPKDKDIETSYTRFGTLGFEDMWPGGGDYDMNDVMVEYTTTITKVTKAGGKGSYMKSMVSDYTFTQRSNAAEYRNAFGLQYMGITDSQIASLTLDGANVSLESGQDAPTFLISTHTNASREKTYHVELVYKENTVGNYFTPYKNTNPFVISQYVENADTRIEIHLPKYPATNRVDPSLIGSQDDAGYIDKSGLYPFAIDIPVRNFEPVAEKGRIGRNEYTGFNDWVESRGLKNADWYLHR